MARRQLFPPPQPTGSSARACNRSRPASPRDLLNRFRLATNGGVAGSGPPALTIGPKDYDAFEKLLREIQSAYGRENTEALGAMTTPEMLSYFSQDLADNAKKGVRNELSDAILLQGDLAEAWQEAGSDFATVAMRYSLVDAMVDRATGRVVSGDGTAPQEVTEVWTFRRDDRDPGRAGSCRRSSRSAPKGPRKPYRPNTAAQTLARSETAALSRSRRQCGKPAESSVH